jgi:hypothetical protein
MRGLNPRVQTGAGDGCQSVGKWRVGPPEHGERPGLGARLGMDSHDEHDERSF